MYVKIFNKDLLGSKGPGPLVLLVYIICLIAWAKINSWTASALSCCLMELTSPKCAGLQGTLLHLHQSTFLPIFRDYKTAPLYWAWIYLHDPFNARAFIVNEIESSPVAYPSLSQCQASAVFHNPFIPSKQVSHGWLLHNTQSFVGWSLDLGSSRPQFLCDNYEETLPKRFTLSDASLLLTRRDFSAPIWLSINVNWLSKVKVSLQRFLVQNIKCHHSFNHLKPNLLNFHISELSSKFPK